MMLVHVCPKCVPPGFQADCFAPVVSSPDPYARQIRFFRHRVSAANIDGNSSPVDVCGVVRSVRLYITPRTSVA